MIMKRILLAISSILIACTFVTAEDTTSEQVFNSKIVYNPDLADTGWAALYDSKLKTRCYTSKKDFYSMHDAGSETFKAQFRHLQPLGIVIKYNGAKIIWGFESIDGLNWEDAKEYVRNYNPDGHTWRLLTKAESQAIVKKVQYFRDTFVDYYPNFISYSGDSFGHISNWTSSMSNDTWTSKSNGKTYNYVYTLEIYTTDADTDKTSSTHEDEHGTVYPISTL